MPALDPALSSKWITNDEHYCYEPGPNGELYVGGKFTFVAPRTGPIPATHPTTGVWQSTALPYFRSGGVYSTCSDGSGGLFVAGSGLTTSGGTNQAIWKVKSDGTLDTTFSPPTFSTNIEEIAFYNGIVYCAGQFATVGGQTRYGFCALDGTTGALQSWNPNTNQFGYGYAIAIDSSTGIIYIGGSFTSAGGQTRNRVAAVNTSGTLQSWNPNISGGSGIVRELVIVGSTIYIGGAFTTVSATTRNGAAAVDTSGTLLNWNPNLGSGTVLLSAITYNSGDGLIYLGGSFTTMGGTTRQKLACVDATNGTLQSWNPGAGSDVNDIFIDGSTIYITGAFLTLAGQSRRYAGAVNTSGTIQSWDPALVASSGYTLGKFGSNIFVAGFVQGLNAVARNRAFAINADGTLSSWNPNFGGDVNTIKYRSADGLLYCGGAFTTAGGSTRNRAAAFNTSGALQSWNPNASSSVYTIAFNQDIIYLGGAFATIGGTARVGIAAVNTSGTLQSFNPTIGSGGNVRSISFADNICYYLGSFSTVGGTGRYCAAASHIDGTLQSWNPNPNSNVYSGFISGSKMYMFGGFSTVGGVTRKYAAATNLTDGALDTSFNINITSTYSVFAATANTAGTSIYLGNYVSQVNGVSAPGGLLKVSASSGARETLTVSDTANASTLVNFQGLLYDRGALYYPSSAYVVSGVWQDTTAPTVSLTSPTASQVISGPITLSATVTDDDSGVNTVKFQRQQLPSGAWVDIGNASLVSGSWQYSFDPTGLSDADYNFRAVATDYAGNTGNSASVQAQIFLNQAPVNTVAPSISGTAKVGQTLTAANGTWTGATPQTYSYQWQRSADGSTGWANISGATSGNYTATVSDIAQYLRVAVTGTNASGTATANSAATSAVVSDPINTAPPAITGTARVGFELSASSGTWTGNPNSYTYAYQWQKSATGSGSWTDISGATSATFTPTSTERGLYLRVSVAATNTTGTTSATSAATTAITMEPANTALPTLSYTGALVVGNTITTDYGTWEAHPSVSYSIAWQSSNDGSTGWTTIPSETNTSYYITSNVAGKYLRASITASNGIGSAQTVYTAASAVVNYAPTNTALPAITGITNLGEELTVSSGTWEGYPALTISYQWQISANGSTGWANIGSATSTTYTTAGTDGAKYLRVAVTGTNTVTTTTVYTSVIGPIAVSPTNDTAPALSGSAITNLVLSTTTGAWTATPSPTYTYQWQYSETGSGGWTNISGATANQYTISTDYTAKYLRAAVTATNVAGSATAYTNASEIVVRPPTNTVRPLTNGPYYPGITITGTAGDWVGYPEPTVNTQWQLSFDGGVSWLDIDGETGLEYLLTPQEFGQQVRILATATNTVATVTEPSDGSQIVVDTPLDNDRSLERPFRVRALPPTDIIKPRGN